ncbi:MAG: pyrroloquinoline quinone biosynthesis peptide chaperone PqqD [Hyphomicrobiales bacterium]|nr:pyrroloquinoline quinone biosynthesis peptide chaperone PqqD [Hyphomicrobiales bacterium]MBV9426308.1 pyrroloquinoline quinone biosynthesis peptide chaperone PqqD [Bradyrhizobiaceae bacterium]
MGDARCAVPCLCGAQARAARRLRAAGPNRVSDVEKTQTVSEEARPRLPRGVRLVHNEAQGGFVLLAPERVFKADAIAAEILKRCTGEATVAAIVDDLAKGFSAPRERVLTDVTKLLGSLADKRLLEL